MRTPSLAVSLIALVGCATEALGPEALTYDEFKSLAYREPDTGFFITNGDEMVETEAAMRQMYDAYLQSVTDADLRELGDDTITAQLALSHLAGTDEKWPPEVAKNLTYCISASGFASHYPAVVQAMAEAALAWQTATECDVQFVHASAHDGNCTDQTAVVFNVRYVKKAPYIARAFFPSTARRGREVVISPSAFGDLAPRTLTGILRHELGHTLGFRHEHTRPESGTCFENDHWRALTAYDRGSVMHYPQCNGVNDGDLELTALDVAGANAVY